MCRLLKLWDALQRRMTSRGLWDLWVKEFGDPADDPCYQGGLMNPTNPRNGALYELYLAINERLTTQTAPRLVGVMSERTPSVVGFRPPPPPDRLEIKIGPEHLLGCLWLQFARAVEGDKEYRRCMARACNNWMEIGKGSYSKRAKFLPSCLSR